MKNGKCQGESRLIKSFGASSATVIQITTSDIIILNAHASGKVDVRNGKYKPLMQSPKSITEWKHGKVSLDFGAVECDSSAKT